MNGKVPHIVQYQGSKRMLAPQILQYMPRRFHRLVEPFAGMAAITIAAASEKRADAYYINDLNEPLVNMLKAAINDPDTLIAEYTNVWEQQFEYGDEHVQHFYEIRGKFNSGEKTPANMLYLLARCVKGSVRYGKDGNFNQSPDKRRHGTSPKTLAGNVRDISIILKNKAEFSALDYRDVFENAKSGDLIYMDPPYQGVTNAKDNRYLSGVPFDEFAEALDKLNRKGIDYLISYDGMCGDRGYGHELPRELGCKKILLNAGLSSQAILLGKREVTFEALYLSRSLKAACDFMPRQICMFEDAL